MRVFSSFVFAMQACPLGVPSEHLPGVHVCCASLPSRCSFGTPAGCSRLLASRELAHHHLPRFQVIDAHVGVDAFGFFHGGMWNLAVVMAW